MVAHAAACVTLAHWSSIGQQEIIRISARGLP